MKLKKVVSAVTAGVVLVSSAITAGFATSVTASATNYSTISFLALNSDEYATNWTQYTTINSITIDGITVDSSYYADLSSDNASQFAFISYNNNTTVSDLTNRAMECFTDSSEITFDFTLSQTLSASISLDVIYAISGDQNTDNWTSDTYVYVQDAGEYTLTYSFANSSVSGGAVSSSESGGAGNTGSSSGSSSSDDWVETSVTESEGHYVVDVTGATKIKVYFSENSLNGALGYCDNASDWSSYAMPTFETNSGTSGWECDVPSDMATTELGIYIYWPDTVIITKVELYYGDDTSGSTGGDTSGSTGGDSTGSGGSSSGSTGGSSGNTGDVTVTPEVNNEEGQDSSGNPDGSYHYSFNIAQDGAYSVTIYYTVTSYDTNTNGAFGYWNNSSSKWVETTFSSTVPSDKVCSAYYVFDGNDVTAAIYWPDVDGVDKSSIYYVLHYDSDYTPDTDTGNDDQGSSGSTGSTGTGNTGAALDEVPSGYTEVVDGTVTKADSTAEDGVTPNGEYHWSIKTEGASYVKVYFNVDELNGSLGYCYNSDYDYKISTSDTEYETSSGTQGVIFKVPDDLQANCTLDVYIWYPSTSDGSAYVTKVELIYPDGYFDVEETTETSNTDASNTDATGNTGTDATGNTGTDATGNTGTDATGNTGTDATGNTGTDATGNTGTDATTTTPHETVNGIGVQIDTVYADASSVAMVPITVTSSNGADTSTLGIKYAISFSSTPATLALLQASYAANANDINNTILFMNQLGSISTENISELQSYLDGTTSSEPLYRYAYVPQSGSAIDPTKSDVMDICVNLPDMDTIESIASTYGLTVQTDSNGNSYYAFPICFANPNSTDTATTLSDGVETTVTINRFAYEDASNYDIKDEVSWIDGEIRILVDTTEETTTTPTAQSQVTLSTLPSQSTDTTTTTSATSYSDTDTYTPTTSTTTNTIDTGDINMVIDTVYVEPNSLAYVPINVVSNGKYDTNSWGIKGAYYYSDATIALIRAVDATVNEKFLETLNFGDVKTVNNNDVISALNGGSNEPETLFEGANYSGAKKADSASLLDIYAAIPDEDTVKSIATQYGLELQYDSAQDCYYYEFPITWASHEEVYSAYTIKNGVVYYVEEPVFEYLDATGSEGVNIFDTLVGTIDGGIRVIVDKEDEVTSTEESSETTTDDDNTTTTGDDNTTTTDDVNTTTTGDVNTTTTGDVNTTTTGDVNTTTTGDVNTTTTGDDNTTTTGDDNTTTTTTGDGNTGDDGGDNTGDDGGDNTGDDGGDSEEIIDPSDITWTLDKTTVTASATKTKTLEYEISITNAIAASGFEGEIYLPDETYALLTSSGSVKNVSIDDSVYSKFDAAAYASKQYVGFEASYSKSVTPSDTDGVLIAFEFTIPAEDDVVAIATEYGLTAKSNANGVYFEFPVEWCDDTEEFSYIDAYNRDVFQEFPDEISLSKAGYIRVFVSEDALDDDIVIETEVTTEETTETTESVIESTESSTETSETTETTELEVEFVTKALDEGELADKFADSLAEGEAYGAGFYFSADTAEFDPADIIEIATVNGEDIMGSVYFEYSTPKELFDAESNGAAYIIYDMSVYYDMEDEEGETVALELGAVTIYSAIKGDVDFSGAVDPNDGYKTLVYYSNYSLYGDASFTSEGGALEILAYFVADINTESKAGAPTGNSTIDPNDSYYMLTYYANASLKGTELWSNVCPDLKDRTY